MKSKVNYQRLLDEKLAVIDAGGHVPTLLLQDCCAPCGSYVISYLAEHFHVTVLFYNPNIYPESEYDKRYRELEKLLDALDTKYPVSVMACGYDSERFYEYAEGYENEPEGGRRCTRCFELRLGETAKRAAEGGFDYFTTTLSVSPHKNADLLNAIGMELGEKYGVSYLCADFKKNDGYKKSIELSKKYELYRQNYCGCEFSLPKSQD